METQGPAVVAMPSNSRILAGAAWSVGLEGKSGNRAIGPHNAISAITLIVILNMLGLIEHPTGFTTMVKCLQLRSLHL